MIVQPLVGCTHLYAQQIANPFPNIAKAYYVERNETPLWAHQLHTPLPPASLTKLAGALVAMDAGQLDAVVNVSAVAAKAAGTRLRLEAGDQITRYDLLVASLVMSANDACLALAQDIAGSEPAFVALMNQKVLSLGLRNTHFENACGFEHPRHRSTVSDLAVLSKAVLINAELAKIVAQSTAKVTITKTVREIKTSNALMGIVEGTVGVKTGFTLAAGKCVIAFVRRGDQTVLAVLLNAPERWWDVAGLIEQAFAESMPRDGKK